MHKINKKKAIHILILFVIALLYLFFVNKTGYGIPCLYNFIFNIKCPGCGVTHMINNIINLDIKNAFYSNPVIFCALPFICFQISKIIYSYVFEEKLKVTKIENIILIILIIIFIIFGIIRNI